METIVISDTNIFIDLINAELLEQFFLLPWEIVTTEPVLLELKYENERDRVKAFSEAGTLRIETFSGGDVANIVKLKRTVEERTNLSFQDCSVWYCAKKNGGKILAGDGQLRKCARQDGIEVRGIIYVIDCIVDAGLIPKPDATDKLNKLKASNPRLPMDEIERRIVEWGGND